MAHVRLTGQPAPPLSTLFDGTMYNLGWDGQRDASVADNILLPSIDYAIYLINAVKFHCGQMFHLFDDVSFMRQFHNFYAATDDDSARGLWYVHFLILLAFGKVFVARKNEGRRPLGADFFVQAMKLMPDITFLHTQPVHAIEVLCCKALYLHCLDFRTSAYTVIGEALRLALGEGMHTNMQVEGLDEQHVQRCRNVWWTVYILDRQMSSLMGVPLAVKDDDITASLPTFHGSLQKTLALELNVKLSGIISRILNMDQLQAYLGWQRIYIFYTISLLKKRLDHLEEEQAIPTTTGSAKALLQMCIESSQHILAVLERLKEQNLLESFLPFDLEGAFVAGMVLLIAPLVDSELLTTQFPWLDMAYATLDELGAQGLLNARARKGELQQLQKVFEQMPQPSQNDFVDEEQAVFMQQQAMHLNMDSENPNFGYEFIEDAIWRTTFTADQLINVANTLDLDGIDWMTTGSNSGIQEDEV
ncbi:hypothetical protein LTR05_008350 [Lithohypha guttulata]|uniref:Xylanolytic transcriptional activator regulatory domain-containing protein n=1 Tax=Lithohypha guttulata TaxID=1690604 RepID=A0AAN7STG2_9EURO|nr:hypothetical protein LTR05_008350 [Lithohypha guttulata]